MADSITLQTDRRDDSCVVVVEGPPGFLQDVQAALDLMSTMRWEYDCDNLLLPKECLPEAFFELSTGLAGEILQKYTNYGLRLAIVGDFEGYGSKSLRDFIRESNKGGRVFFLPDLPSALDALHKPPR